ncbi:hypothetical protein BGW42_000394, partial [Actinomortierella wolfii]
MKFTTVALALASLVVSIQAVSAAAVDTHLGKRGCPSNICGTPGLCNTLCRNEGAT